MTSKTKKQILNDCFNELRINGITASADNEDIKLALGRLEDLMAEQTFNIGFRFEKVPDPNSYSGIPAYANFAIASLLALRLCPAYGKAPESLIRQVSQAMGALLNRVATPRRVSYPCRQPLGMGNRRAYNYHQFMPEVVQAPNSVDTYQMNVGDRLVSQSIDFSQYLQPLEAISSYTKTLSSGIQVSDESTVGASILFSLTALEDGFQQVLFTVTGSSGSKVNRTIDINVIDSTSARGNP